MILEDQCLAPGATDEKFLSAAYTGLKGNEKFLPGKVCLGFRIPISPKLEYISNQKNP